MPPSARQAPSTNTPAGALFRPRQGRVGERRSCPSNSSAIHEAHFLGTTGNSRRTSLLAKVLYGSGQLQDPGPRTADERPVRSGWSNRDAPREMGS
jgi:hypothetical protein